MEQIIAAVKEMILVGGGAVVIVFTFLKWFGKKFFEHQFAESLEQFKRQQSELLEQYRYQINAQFNRITKIHEKEFEVLPQVWRLLQDAYGHFMGLTNLMQYWPSLNSFSSEELEAFLNTCELEDYQKKDLRNSNNRLEYYQQQVYWKRLNVVIKHFNEFRVYLGHNKIFLTHDLFELFCQIESSMIATQVELEDPESGNNPWRGMGKLNKHLRDNVGKLSEQIEKSVQERLHFDEAK